MNRLPEVADGRNAFVVVRSQRNMYDRAIVVAGGRIVEVGIPDRFSGPGVRDAGVWEIEDAIGKDTAAVYYLAAKQSRPGLREIAEAAHRHGVPVLVDAAGQLPPVENLRRFLADGADLVCFSGGKAIGGPQSSGILCGRADLVGSALLQMLDLDVEQENFVTPPEFGHLAQMRGLPHHGIGRSCKVGKEEIAGLLVALRRFSAADPVARQASWRSILQTIVDAAGEAGTRIVDGAIPLLTFDAGSPEAAAQVARRLAEGSPSIQCSLGRHDEGLLVFNPTALTGEQAGEIGRRLHDLR
jgi:D-glucosaminate-6-phosphate ammonia-lyase